MIISYLIDFGIVAALVVGTTALNGVIGSGVGLVIGGKNKSQYILRNQQNHTGWKMVGGKNNR